MSKKQWIDQYAMMLMSSYSAIQYDHNCFVGWREKEQYMTAEDAYTLAAKAYERVKEFKKLKDYEKITE